MYPIDIAFLALIIIVIIIVIAIGAIRKHREALPKIKIPPVMSTMGFVIAVVSLIISIRTCSIQERVAHLTVEPNVTLYVKGGPPTSTVYVHNLGPISVSNISVSRFIITVPFGENAKTQNKEPSNTAELRVVHDTAPNWTMPQSQYFFPKKPELIVDEKATETDPLGELWKFSISLEPRKFIMGEFHFHGSIDRGTEQIAVHVYDLAYFRPSDMTEYRKRIFFYDDGKTVFNQSDFSQHALNSYVTSTVFDDRYWPLKVMRQEYTRKKGQAVTRGKP